MREVPRQSIPEYTPTRAQIASKASALRADAMDLIRPFVEVEHCVPGMFSHGGLHRHDVVLVVSRIVTTGELQEALRAGFAVLNDRRQNGAKTRLRGRIGLDKCGANGSVPGP